MCKTGFNNIGTSLLHNIGLIIVQSTQIKKGSRPRLGQEVVNAIPCKSKNNTEFSFGFYLELLESIFNVCTVFYAIEKQYLYSLCNFSASCPKPNMKVLTYKVGGSQQGGST